MRRMRRTPVGFALGLAAIAVPVVASAQDDGSCSYEGRRYASGYAVCQAGQVQTCIGGEWQGNGTFCVGSPDDRALGVQVIAPGELDTATARTTGMPIQNAPLDE